MTWRRQICWTAACDVCSNGWGEEHDEQHFPAREDLVEYLKGAEWTVGSGVLVCPDCLPGHACAVGGHEWGDWLSVDRFPRPDGGHWSGRVRYCGACDASEFDSPPGRLPKG